jgi:hypothetical protein
MASLPVSVVERYLDLFYDVGDRLSGMDCILLTALGKRHTDLSAEDFGPILRYFGYFGGPLVLDAVARYALAPSMDASLLPESEQRLAHAVRRAIWALTLRVEQFAEATETEIAPVCASADQATDDWNFEELAAEIIRLCKKYGPFLGQSKEIAAGVVGMPNVGTQGTGETSGSGTT